MFTISRRADESIVIQTPDGDEIRVVVHSFQKDKIEVSIDASKGSQYYVRRINDG